MDRRSPQNSNCLKPPKDTQVNISFHKDMHMHVKNFSVQHLLYIRAKLSFPISVSHCYCSFRPKRYRGKDKIGGRTYSCD